MIIKLSANLLSLYLFWIQLKWINIHFSNKANDRSNGGFTKLEEMVGKIKKSIFETKGKGAEVKYVGFSKFYLLDN